MSAPGTEVSTHNRLLQALPAADYRRLVPRFRAVQLPRGRIICDAGDPADYVYFPLRGVVSLLSITEDGESIEVGMVGNEGATGVPIITRSGRLPYRAVVRIPADALRCEASVLRSEFERGSAFSRVIVSYTEALFTQIAQSAVCNRFHSTEERLCRWLLSTHDRVESDILELTHESISNMLGTQRPVVSATAAVLQRKGLISYSRGAIKIVNRPGLEFAACECYRIVRESMTSSLEPVQSIVEK